MYLGMYCLFGGVGALVYLINGGKVFLVCLGIFVVGIICILASSLGIHNRLVSRDRRCRGRTRLGWTDCVGGQASGGGGMALNIRDAERHCMIFSNAPIVLPLRPGLA